MLKIEYPPKDTQGYTDFLNNYLKAFNTKDLQSKFDGICNKSYFSMMTERNIERILTMPFEDLIMLNKSFLKCNPTKTDIKKLQKIFNYDTSYKPYVTVRQKPIAKFFVNNQELLNIKTCYFCNLEYINSFVDVADYCGPIDLVNRASKEDLININQIVEDDAQSIMRLRKNFSGKKLLEHIESIFSNKKYLAIKNMNFNERKHYFTLDHVIDKGNNPLTALSLFNLVPSCYACNSKFKGKLKLVSTIKDAHLSPTSDKFDFHSKNKFEITFSSDTENISNIKNTNDFTMRLNLGNKTKGYGKYEKIFKLNARYKEHKEDVLELISNSMRYPKTHIDSISKLVGVTSTDLKKTIFGKEITLKELNSLPKAKLIKDIADQLKL